MSEALQSWGRYPYHLQTPASCYWRADIKPELERLARQFGSALPFGNGRSYGDSCLAQSDHVLHLRQLDRFISADWQTGLVRAEAGMTLDELLAQAIPRGWFLPVTPGTRFATLGGALANDVHGKNHHVRGTFGCHVTRFGLIRSDRPPMECSAAHNTEFFTATIGGLGLTGVVQWLELQLMPIRSSLLDTTQVRFDNLSEFFALSEELDTKHEYAVAWIDCVARGSALGRGVYMVGDHAAEGPLQVTPPTRLNVPFTPPLSAINGLSLRVLNTSYFRLHKAGRQRQQVGYEPFFYPLDGVTNWNRLYGPRGFQQYQCVLPHEHAHASTREMLKVIAASGTGSFLAVLKRFGDMPSPGLLSFPTPGVTLALDFPLQDKTLKALFPKLDTIVREARGRLYPAKDAHMTSDDFKLMYPASSRLEALRDPALCSRFWQRTTRD